MKAIYILTDCDFSLPEDPNITKFGNCGYIIAAEDADVAVAQIIARLNPDNRSLPMLTSWMEGDRDDHNYLACGNWFISVTDVDTSAKAVIDAAMTLSGVVQD